jgi:hypothetical protein
MHRSRTSRKLVELFAILAIVLCVRALSGARGRQRPRGYRKEALRMIEVASHATR